MKIDITRYLCVLFVMFSLTMSDALAQFNALDYRLQKRPKLETFDNPKFFDNTFISVGAGVQLNFLGDLKGTEKGPLFRYSFGKWFTPVIGARVGLDMSFLYDHGTKTHALFGFNADYLANISAFVKGYDPDRLFELYGIAGLTYKRSYRYGFGTNLYGGVLGLQGNFNLSRLLSVYIEPKVTLANDGYNEDEKNLARKFDLLPEVSVGLSYKMVPAEKRNVSEYGEWKLKDHLFFTGAFGVQRVTSRLFDIKNGKFVGYEGMLGMGGWFTPIQGFRASFVAGKSPYLPESSASEKGYNLVNLVGRADYLVNYSNLFGGYRHDRIFNLIGTFGLELAETKYFNTDWKFSGGLGLGLQGLFRVSPNVDLFMEPRVSFYNKTYTHGEENRFDGVASMLFGLVYRGDDRVYAERNSKFVNKSHADNMFISTSFGVGGKLGPYSEDLSFGQSITYKFDVTLGKWFTAISGLQVSGGTLLYGTRNGLTSTREPYRARTLTLGIDYLLNASNLCMGYNENRIFDLIGGLGVSALYHHTTFYPALHALLRGNFNLKNNWSVYVEPQALWVFARRVLTNSVATRKSLAMTASVGASYNLRGYDKASYRKFKEEEGKRMFMSFAAGISGILDNQLFQNTRFSVGPIARLSVGMWETPLFGWRVNVMGERVNSGGEKRSIAHGGLEADAMFNLMTAAKGYEPNRLFDLNFIAGVHTGFSIVEHDMRFIPGVKGSVQANFNVTPNIGLYVEPQLAIYLNKFNGYDPQKTVASFMAGLTYSMNQRDKNRNLEASDMDTENFVSVYGGIGLYGNALMTKFPTGFADKMTYSGGVAYGRWLTPVHGLRLNVEYNNVHKPAQPMGSVLNILAPRVDYMLNISSLVSGYDSDRLFDASFFAGIGTATPIDGKKRKAKTTYNIAFGLKANVRINDKIDFYLEPRGVFYGDKIDGYISNAGFDATGMLLAGFDIKF